MNMSQQTNNYYTAIQQKNLFLILV